MKNLNKQIDKLNCILHGNGSTYSVYPYDKYSIQEVICEVVTKINEVIDVASEYTAMVKSLLEWIQDEGIATEVKSYLDEMLLDGTLAEIINTVLFDELEQKILNNTNLISEVHNKVIETNNKIHVVTVENFGAIGDGVTDDTQALQNAFNWSKENKQTIFLKDKKYYVTSPLLIGGAIIRSLSGVPGYADPYLLSDGDGNYLTGNYNWNYFFNIGSGVNISWRQMIDFTCKGCSIISDKDINILFIENNTSANIEGVGVIGNHRAKNQKGITDNIPNKYMGNIQHFKNINVIGCGNTGITLNRGLECVVLENVNCKYNMGYGLFTGKNNFNSATEYIDFLNCNFSYNRLDGVKLSYARKHIYFTNCNINGNGQYMVGGVDALLGYNRTIPTTVKDIVAGIFISDGGGTENNNELINVKIDKCYGEEISLGVKIINNTGRGVANNFTIENNTFYKIGGGVADDKTTACMYFDVNYISDWTIDKNLNHALTETVVFEKMPNVYQNVHIYPMDDRIEQHFNQPIKSDYSITSLDRIYGKNIVFKNVGDGVAKTLTDDSIKNEFKTEAVLGEGNIIGTFLLSSHFTATQLTVVGCYMIVVTKSPNRSYAHTVMAFGDTCGFTTPPTVTTDGVLNWGADNYFKFTLTRLDIAKTF